MAGAFSFAILVVTSIISFLRCHFASALGVSCPPSHKCTSKKRTKREYAFVYAYKVSRFTSSSLQQGGPPKGPAPTHTPVTAHTGATSAPCAPAAPTASA